MKALITKEYYKIASDLKISYNNPAADFVKIQMKANCKDRTKDDRSLTCENVKINDTIEVSADIKLEPEICVSGLKSLDISFKVFGQSDSTMTLRIGIFILKMPGQLYEFTFFSSNLQL